MMKVAYFRAMKGKRRLKVVIPAFNEKPTIGMVVAGVRRSCPRATVLVVDDASTDNTAAEAKKSGAEVMILRKNRGSGAAIRAGMERVLRQGAQTVVLMDADGQHDPAHIPQLLAGLTAGTGCVIGSRYMVHTESSTSLLRQFGTWCISQLLDWKFDTKIYDPTSGFRVLDRKTATRLARIYPAVFPEPETILTLCQNRVPIKEVPVQMNPRVCGQSSIGPVRAWSLMVYICWRILTFSGQDCYGKDPE